MVLQSADGRARRQVSDPKCVARLSGLPWGSSRVRWGGLIDQLGSRMACTIAVSELRLRVVVKDEGKSKTRRLVGLLSNHMERTYSGRM